MTRHEGRQVARGIILATLVVGGLAGLTDSSAAADTSAVDTSPAVEASASGTSSAGTSWPGTSWSGASDAGATPLPNVAVMPERAGRGPAPACFRVATADGTQVMCWASA